MLIAIVLDKPLSEALALSNIDLSCIGLAFAFLNTTEESSKLRQRWGAEVTDLVGKGFRRDVLLGVDHCREIIKLTTESYKQYRLPHYPCLVMGLLLNESLWAVPYSENFCQQNLQTFELCSPRQCAS